jgi:3-oxoacyl-(acyl-carrier-protein) synthase
MILGEGAAFLVLESLESATARGATPLFEVLGHHATADRPVRHGSDPSGDGLARAMAGALAEANVAPAVIDTVSAGALSHPRLDAIEARALARVFGAPIPPVTAMSSLVGVSGATGPLALAALGLGIGHGFLPSGHGTAELDHDMPLDVIAQGPRRGSIRHAIANAVSLGGANVSLVLAALG